jgi:rhomboid protease GluP
MAVQHYSSSEDFLDALFSRVPRAGVTLALVGLNIAVFLALAVQAGALWHVPGAVLADWGGNYAVQTRAGQWWRLVSALFLHGGLLHVSLNMLALYQAGQLAERLFGHRRFLFIYVACGALASVASVWWRPDGLSIGASGAVFGVFGALLSHVLVCRASVPPGLFHRLRKALLGFIAYSLIAGFLLPGIDNAAHVGGLLAGLVLGAALAEPLGETTLRLNRAAAGAGVVALAAVLLLQATPPVKPARMQTYAFNAIGALVGRQETQLVQRYQLLADALRAGRMSDAQAVAVIENELIPGWKALEETVAAAGHGDWRAEALLRYLAKRRDALQVLMLAIETHQQKWIELANALQAQADEYLLQYRLLVAGGDVPTPERSRAPD